MDRLRHPVVIRVCQLVIGAIFIAAALPKIGDMKSFAAAVHNFRLMPVAFENLAAMTLPWIELVAGLALILGIRARAGAWIVSVMLVAFTLGVAQAMARGLDFECGCFGTGDGGSVGAAKLLENLAMLAVAAVASLRSR